MNKQIDRDMYAITIFGSMFGGVLSNFMVSAFSDDVVVTAAVVLYSLLAIFIGFLYASKNQKDKK